MKKIIAICFFLAMSQSPGFSQNEELNRLWYRLQSAQNDTARVLIMTQLGQIYMFTRPDSGIFYANKALSLAREINHPQGEVNALGVLANSLRELGNYPTALQVNLKNLRISEEYNLLFEKAHILGQIGLIYNAAGDYQKALYLFKESKGIFDSIQSPGFSVLTQGRLIETYQLMGQYDSALFYTEIAIGETEVLQNKWPELPLSIAVGEVYKKMGNYPLAIQYFKKAIELEKLWPIDAPTAYYNLAQIQKNLNNVDSSIYYVKNSLSGALTRGSYPQIIDAYRMMAEIYESQDPVQANKYNKLAIAYKDSLELIGKTVALDTFIEFDEQERRRELAAAEKEFKSQQKTNAMLAGTLMLLVIAAFLYRNNRQKQKAKLKIETAYDQLKSTQNQLIHSEKMSSLGELTAGIAHEIQNPLNFVNNFSEVNKELIDELKEAQVKGDQAEIDAITKDIFENEDKIMHHGKRAEAIVKSMLQHSRTSTGEKELTDINKLADEYLRLAYHGFRAKDKTFNAQYNTDFDPKMPGIKVIPQDIGRVILNLITNAFHAVSSKASLIAESSSKVVATEEPEFKPTVSVQTRNLDNSILISIKDNGAGIPDSIKDKIFQPFFTTKATGEGTGLGLSMSYDIITKGHSGQLTVESKEGEGSTFTITLPKT